MPVPKQGPGYMRSRNARILIRAVQLGPRHVAVGLPALSLSAASSEKLERVCLNTWAIILAALGGVFEIFGVGMVVREISKDRKRAETYSTKSARFGLKRAGTLELSTLGLSKVGLHSSKCSKAEASVKCLTTSRTWPRG